MWLIVGLGNPGADYVGTRHNVGFEVIDALVDQHGFDGKKEKYQGHYWNGDIAEQKVLLLKPQTFMNRSGISVSQVATFFKIPPQKTIIVYDELDLDTGKVRVKQGGGTGGHNGIKSIDSHIGNDYWRVRIGIDHPGDPDKVSGYVLRAFNAEQRTKIDATIASVVENLPWLLEERADNFMNNIALDTQE